MQMPFPELTVLVLRFSSVVPASVSPIPDSFLGGSAPRLQRLGLVGIPFPGLPKLLLSATHLVELRLSEIPHSWHISPEAMVTLISMLSRLRTFSLRFQFSQSHSDWENRSLAPPNHSILHTLHEFYFKGIAEYLEELVTHIDTPQLNMLDITFLNQFNFDSPRLVQFVNRTPTLMALDEAHVEFPSVQLRRRTSRPYFYNLLIRISFREPGWQPSPIEQVCNSSLLPLSTVEDLYIKREFWQLVRKKGATLNTLWLQLLRPYITVKNLYLSKEFVPGVADALEELVGARITEVLPSLQNIFVEVPESLEPFQEMFGQFVAARQLSGHPVAILSGTEIRSRLH